MPGIKARSLLGGRAAGRVLQLEQPLSFWGGVDVETGEIIDHHHPQKGLNVAGRVLVMPSGRGSSSSSSVLAEVIRAGHGPRAIVMKEPDGIVTLGALVAAEIYEMIIPVLVVDAEAYASLESGREVRVEGGEITIVS